MAGNTSAIVAIELLAAAQAVDLRKPLTTSPRLAAVLAQIRSAVPFWERDRALSPDLAVIRAKVEAGAFVQYVGSLLPD
jgi:histidine ammonia-lyase